MSTPARRAELAAQWEIQQEKNAVERDRKENLSMLERIDEADTSESVKDILRRIVEHIGMT